jgi:hypothetical protein
MKQAAIAVLAASLAAPVAAQDAPTPAQREACMPDYQKFCASVLPGGGRILRCLREHSVEIGDRCRMAISAANVAK